MWRSSYHSVSRVAAELGVTDALVTMYLPYEKVVYDLDDKSGNARRIERWREKKNQSKHDEQEQMNPRDAAVKVLYENRETADATLNLWKAVIAFAGDTFTTSGRGVRPGVDFTYRISEPGQAGGRHLYPVTGMRCGSASMVRRRKKASAGLPLNWGIGMH